MEKAKSKKLLTVLIIIAVVAVIAVTAVIIVLVINSGIGSFLKEPEKKEYYSYSTQISELDGYSIDSTSYGAAVVSKYDSSNRETEYGLYNFNENKFIIDPSADHIVEYSNGLFRSYSSNSYSTLDQVYDYYTSTSRIASFTNPSVGQLGRKMVSISSSSSDIIYYVNRETGVVNNATRGLKTLVTSASYETDRFFLSGSSSIIRVFDKNSYELVRDISPFNEMPGYTSASASGILGNGNYFVQYSLELPDGATEYDYIYGVTKYDLKTFIIDVGNGSVYEKDVNYVISSVYNALNEYDYKYAYNKDNVAAVKQIKDKYLLDTGIVMINDSLDITFDYKDFSPSSSQIYRVSGDRYFSYIDYTGKLYDGGGNLLAESISSANENYFIKNEKIYDINTLSVKWNIADSESVTKRHQWSYGSLICWSEDNDNDDKTEYFVNGNKIEKYNNHIGYNLITTRDTTNHYTLYAFDQTGNMTSLASSDYSFTYEYADTDSKYVIVSSDNKVYKITNNINI